MEEGVFNIKSYLYSWRKVDALKILPAKTVSDGKGIKVPHREPGKGVLGPFRGKGKLQLLKQSPNTVYHIVPCKVCSHV